VWLVPPEQPLLIDLAFLPDPINSSRWPPESSWANTRRHQCHHRHDAHPRQEDDNTKISPVLEPSNRTHAPVPEAPASPKAGLVLFFPFVLGPPFRCTGPDGNPSEPTQRKSPKYPSAHTPPHKYLAGFHRPKVPTPPPDWAHQPTHCRSTRGPDPRCGGSPPNTTTHPHLTRKPSNGISSPPLPPGKKNSEAVWSSRLAFLSPSLRRWGWWWAKKRSTHAIFFIGTLDCIGISRQLPRRRSGFSLFPPVALHPVLHPAQLR